MAVKKELLDILVCPKCKDELSRINEEDQIIALDCSVCKLRYEIKDDIPIMLIDEAIKI